MQKLIRTTIVVFVSAALVLLLFWRLTVDHERRAYEEIETLRTDMTRRLEAREAMIDRLSRSRRIAHLRVLGQTLNGDGRIDATSIELIELDELGVNRRRNNLRYDGTLALW